MKNYDMAVEKLREYGDNPSTRRVSELLKAESQMLDATSKLCTKLVKYCDDYAAGKKLGYGYRDAQIMITKLLEELAQNGENHIKKRRSILDEFGVHIAADEVDIPAPLPAASYGEPITIEYLKELQAYRVELPELLPFRLEKGASFLYPKIVHYMSEFSENWKKEHGSRPHIPHAFVVFIHHYIEDLRSPKLRDSDNLEHRCVLNALQTSGLFDDAPSRLVSMEFAKSGAKNYTEILIAPTCKIKEIAEKLCVFL